MPPHLSICVVGTDRAVVAVLRFLLVAMGFRSPTCFENAQAAWAYIAASAPDLVLVDCRDGSLSALRLIEQIRANDETASLPVIALSASNSEDCWRNAIKAGATEFLFTPFNIRDLHAAMQIALFNACDELSERKYQTRARTPA